MDSFWRQSHGRGAIFWNVTDGVSGFKGSHVVSLATLLDIPYFGSPPFAQAIAQDKYKLYLLCQALGIPVPASALVEGGEVLNSFIDADSQGPYFVKPNSLGNKIGLYRNSLQQSFPSAVRHAETIGAEIHDRMVIQKFVEGVEVRLSFINATSDEPRFGYDLVDDAKVPGNYISFSERDSKYEVFEDFQLWTGMPDAARMRAMEIMARSVLTLANHIRLKDYFTFDFRLDSNGLPWMIDFNPGAFLCGADVEGYASHNLGMPLGSAIFSAITNAFNGNNALKTEATWSFRL